MKKILITIGLFTLLATGASAQKMYFRTGLGYAFPHGGQVRMPVYTISPNAIYPVNGSFNAYYNTTPVREVFDMKKTSFTAGVQGVLALGAMLNDHIGVEVSANVGLATTQIKSTLNEEVVQVKTSVDITQQCKNPLFITPSLVVQSGGKINIYARGGIVLPAKTIITSDVNYTEDRLNPADSSMVRTVFDVSEKYTMRLSPGLAGAMGVKIKAAPKTTVWAEFSLLSMNMYYRQSEITSFRQNGVDMLPQLSPVQRTSKYEFEGTNIQSDNVFPTYAVPYSNFGIQVGVAYELD